MKAISLAVVALAVGMGGCEQKKVALPSTSAAPGINIPSSTTRSRNGRYVIAFSPLVRADTFLLDTQTGKTWQPTTFTDLAGEPTVWEEMTVIDDSPDITERILGSVTTFDFYKYQTKKSESKKKKGSIVPKPQGGASR